jgi:hypothetical protein
MRGHNHRVLTASTTTVRETPQEFFDWIDGMMHFTVDVCANKKNAKHPKFYDERQNGLAQSWAGETWWENHPYGRQTPAWMAKSREEAMYGRSMGCSLIAARVGSDWWRRYVRQLDGAAGKLRDVRVMQQGYDLTWYRFEKLTVGIYFHDERLPFDDMETGAPFDAALIFYAHPSRRPVKPIISSNLPARREWPMLVEGWP